MNRRILIYRTPPLPPPPSNPVARLATGIAVRIAPVAVQHYSNRPLTVRFCTNDR